MNQGQYDKAEEIMSALVAEAEKVLTQGMYQDDTANEYYTFQEMFEDLLYREIYQPSKELHKAEIPFTDIYLQYGKLLICRNQIGKANKILEKAVRWNPVSTKIVFRYAFKPEDYARCYRNLEYYYAKKEQWAE